MTSDTAREHIHSLDVTVWVGKNGIGAVTDELSNQLEQEDFVKVKFLRSARGSTDTESLAEALADQSNSILVETRGHTAVYQAR